MGLTKPRLSQINTSVSGLSDPIVVVNQGSNQANVDIGFLLNRNNGVSSNIALFWSESGNQFVLGFTNNTGITNSNVQLTEYANLSIKSLYLDNGILSSNTGTVTTSNLLITSNLTVQGTQFVANTTDVAFTDSVIELHTQSNLAPLQVDDGRDIGLKFHYYKTKDEHAFLGWANDTGYLEWYDSGREGVGNVFTGNTYGTIKSGEIYLVNTTPSTSTTTGVLRVAGGAGIAGNLYTANVYSSRVYTTNGIYWSGNGVSFSSQPGGSNSQIQFNDNNLFGASANLTFDKTHNDGGGLLSVGYNNRGVVQTNVIITSGNIVTNSNIQAVNAILTGNVYGNIAPTAIYKNFYIGTTSVELNRVSESLTVDNFNTTGYAVQSNLASLATNATKTTITSNTTAGTAYITYVAASSGNVDQNVSTALTFNPATGNLRAYTGFIDTDLIVGGNLTVQNISYTNQEIITTTEISQGNLIANSGVESTSNVTGALIVRGGVGVTGNVYANVLYTYEGIRWASNNAVFQSGGGGGAGLPIDFGSITEVAFLTNQLDFGTLA